MNKQMKDIVIVGFALFSMFFGAGNLLFPPYLGMESGQSWIVPVIAFVLADAGISLLVLIASARHQGRLEETLDRAGKTLARVIGIVAIGCLGFIVIPRTAATTYEMGILPIIGNFGMVGRVGVSVVFFILTLALTISGSKVIDIIGKFLTPALLIVLFILIIKGIVSPIAAPSPDTMVDTNLFALGFTSGYQTMDALGAASMATIMILSLTDKGYTDEKEKTKMTIKSGIVACFFLTLVYGGLAYLGATVSTKYGLDVEQSSLLVNITSMIFGYGGNVLLGIIVSLACLTTSIGITAVVANYFSGITKIKYEHYVIGICIFGALFANVGVSVILQIAGPILSLIYPVLLVIVLMRLAGKYIPNDNAFKGAAYATIFVSACNVLTGYMPVFGFINVLPLSASGFNWILPAVICGIIGSFIRSGRVKAEN
ncbi:MAG: branched-chain amino acid transport system II carrier protein [Clostridioides sp.]|nr:branched-chain amino acid transport system II carrier protein [Clostridioides sp.]